jgi:hypothetical protein
MRDLPILDELGADLQAAFREQQALRRRPLRPLGLAAVILVLLAASAGAATYYVLRASPIAPLKPGDVEPQQRVAPGTSRVLGLRAADPERDEPPWALRIARSQTGLTCGTVGQIVDGEFGIVGLDRRFRALPEANADACSVPGTDGLTLLGLRVFDADEPADVRTVLDGLADPPLRRVQVSLAGGSPRTVAHDSSGAFLLALRGYPEDLQPVVTVTFKNGRTKRVALATSDNVVPDPLGGGAWRTEVGGFGCPARAGRAPRTCNPPECVTFSSARQGPDSASSPGLCGKSDNRRGRPSRALFYGARRLSGDRRLMRSPFSGRWNGHAPRTALWGLVPPELVASIEVTGPGGLRRVARPALNRAFLVVLDPKVDPKSLRVAIHYRDGRVVRTGPDHHLVPTPKP